MFERGERGWVGGWVGECETLGGVVREGGKWYAVAIAINHYMCIHIVVHNRRMLGEVKRASLI